MSTDLGMVMLDIVCTFWESAMFVYLVHVFKKEKASIKVDIAMMCIFVVSAEIATFAGSNVLLKMMLLMLCCSVSGVFIYRNKIQPMEMLLAFNAFAVYISSMAMVHHFASFHQHYDLADQAIFAPFTKGYYGA